MRVITGSARGRRLKTLDGVSVRPTTDKVKEAMFSIIQFEIEGRRVLDMFAGCGQLGIEALSRGAESAVFTDVSREALAVVKENIKTAGFESNSKTVLANSLEYLDRSAEVFDLAFLDPPYNAGIMCDALERLCPHIANGGTVICETSAEEVLPGDLDGFTSKRYKYGKVALTVYRKDA